MSLLFWIATTYGMAHAMTASSVCGQYEARGWLDQNMALVVNKGTLSEYRLLLDGHLSSYRGGALPGNYVVAKGVVEKPIKNFRGHLRVDSVRLEVPDPINNQEDQLKLTNEKPCHD